MAIITELIAKISADTAQADTALRDFGLRMTRAGFLMSATMSAPMAALGNEAIQAVANFDREIGVLGSVVQATDADMSRLTNTARALGSDLTLPGVTAQQAAGAMNELAKAGLTTNQVIEASRGTVQLAVAGQLQHAEAARITAGALHAFNLEGEEATRVANVLAASAIASATDVSEMGQAFSNASAVWGQAGMTVEDLSSALGIMANNAIVGGEAGTALKTMLLRLIAPTDTTKRILEDLGIAIYDSAGNLTDMRHIVEQFTAATHAMTEEERNNYFLKIFGTKAVRGANVILAQGVEQWDRMNEAVQRNTALEELMAGQMAGAAGSVEMLGNAWDAMVLKIGESSRGMIMGAAESLAGLLDVVTNLPEGFFQVAFAGGAAVAALGPLMMMGGTLIYSWGSLAGVFGSVAASLGMTSPMLLAVGAAAVGLAATGIIIAQNWDTVKAKFDDTIDTGERLWDVINRINQLGPGAPDAEPADRAAAGWEFAKQEVAIFGSTVDATITSLIGGPLSLLESALAGSFDPAMEQSERVGEAWGGVWEDAKQGATDFFNFLRGQEPEVDIGQQQQDAANQLQQMEEAQWAMVAAEQASAKAKQENIRASEQAAAARREEAAAMAMQLQELESYPDLLRQMKQEWDAVGAAQQLANEAMVGWSQIQAASQITIDHASAGMQAWKNDLSEVEQAIEILQDAADKGIATPKMLQNLAFLTDTALPRVQAGIDDTEGAFADAVVVQEQLRIAQDEYNEAVKNNAPNVEELQARVRDLAGQLDPMAGLTMDWVASNDAFVAGMREMIAELRQVYVEAGLIEEIDPTVEVDSDLQNWRDAQTEVDGWAPRDHTIQVQADAAEAYRVLAELSQTEPEPVTGTIWVDDSDARATIGDVDGLTLDPKTAMILGDNTDYTQVHEVTDGMQFSDKTVILLGNAIDALSKIAEVDATTLLDHWTNLFADPSNALSGIGAVQGAIATIPSTISVYVDVQTADAENALFMMRGMLPSSPAKWGPFSTLPDWDVVFDGFAAAAEGQTGEAIDHLKAYMEMVKAVVDVQQSIFDFTQAVNAPERLSLDVSSDDLQALDDLGRRTLDIFRNQYPGVSEEEAKNLKAAGDSIQAAFASFGGALEFAVAYSEAMLAGNFQEPPTEFLTRLSDLSYHALGSVNWIAHNFSPEMLEQSQIAGETIPGVWSALGGALEFAATYSEAITDKDLHTPPIEFLTKMSDLSFFALGMVNWVAHNFSPEMLEQAQTGSDTIQGVWSALGGALEFAAAYSEATLDQDLFTPNIEFLRQLSDLSFETVGMLNWVANQFPADVGENAERIGGAIEATWGALGSVVDFLRALSGSGDDDALVIPSDEEIDAAGERLVGMAVRLTERFMDASDHLNQETVDAAASLADSFGPILDTMVPMAEGVDALATMGSLTEDQMDRFEDNIRLVMASISELRDLADAGLDDAKAFRLIMEEIAAAMEAATSVFGGTSGGSGSGSGSGGGSSNSTLGGMLGGLQAGATAPGRARLTGSRYVRNAPHTFIPGLDDPRLVEFGGRSVWVDGNAPDFTPYGYEMLGGAVDNLAFNVYAGQHGLRDPQPTAQDLADRASTIEVQVQMDGQTVGKVAGQHMYAGQQMIVGLV